MFWYSKSWSMFILFALIIADYKTIYNMKLYNQYENKRTIDAADMLLIMFHVHAGHTRLSCISVSPD